MVRIRIRRSFCLLAYSGFLLAFVLSTQGRAQPPAEEKKYAKEFYFDFRGKPLPEEMTMVGKDPERFVKPEPLGIRITLPAARANAGPLGVGTRFKVQGDFEITATVEILQADVPEKGFGVGATLYIHKVDPPTEGTNIGRLLRPKGDMIMWDRRYEKPGKEPTFGGTSKPCTDKLVRLRLQRTGSALAYLWAVGASGGEFTKLNQNEFGTDEVQQVMLRARTEGPYNVDVRFIDLRVRSGGVTIANDAPAAKLDPGAAPPVQGSRIRLVVALLVGLAFAFLLALGLGIWLFLRKRADSSGELVSFPCPKCARTLKAKAELAGKKVKCVQCGAVALVPSIEAGEASGASS